jgi:hypothetical protein
MYYQTDSLSKDKAPTVCTIVDVKNEKYIVEYNDNGEFKTKEINPEELQKLDYSELDISQ